MFLPNSLSNYMQNPPLTRSLPLWTSCLQLLLVRAKTLLCEVFVVCNIMFATPLSTHKDPPSQGHCRWEHLTHKPNIL